MITCEIFTTEKELSKLTNLNHKELWENGFNLDDWDIGFCCNKELTNEEWWLLTQMEYYGVGFEKVKYRDKVYYMVYHS